MQIVVYRSFLYMPVVCITLHVMCHMLDVQRSDWCRRQRNVSPAVSDCTEQSHCTVPWESFCAGGCRRPVEVRCSLILLLHAALYASVACALWVCHTCMRWQSGLTLCQTFCHLVALPSLAWRSWQNSDRITLTPVGRPSQGCERFVIFNKCLEIYYKN